MSEHSAIMFIEMQFRIMSNPIKKAQIWFHVREFRKQMEKVEYDEQPHFIIVSYLETELAKDKKRSMFETQWLQICLKLFQELESEHYQKKLNKNIPNTAPRG